MQLLDVNEAECEVWDTRAAVTGSWPVEYAKSIQIYLRPTPTAGISGRWTINSDDGILYTPNTVKIPSNVVAACVVWLQSGGYPLRQDRVINEHIRVLMKLVDGYEPADFEDLRHTLGQSSSLSRAVKMWLQGGYGGMTLQEFLGELGVI